MESATSLARKPIDPMAKAHVPATGPRPSAATKITARISSGTARTSRIHPRAAQYMAAFGVMLRAARMPTGMDSTIPIAVATTPIATVWTVASNSAPPSVAKFGGIIRAKTSIDGPTQVSRDSGLIFKTSSAATVRPMVARRTRTAWRGRGAGWKPPA